MLSYLKTLTVCLTAVACAWLVTLKPAQATYKSIAYLKTPVADLTLVANTITAVPGTYCSVTVRHHAADPVYWGGPKIGGAVVAGTTVNAAGGMAICTDTTLCESDYISLNVMTGGIALLSVAGTSVEYTVGEGCQP